jgi:hypothetical protein
VVDPVVRPSIVGCRAKLDRAEHHLKTLGLEIDRFREANPIRVTAMHDAGCPLTVQQESPPR